jgi:hypothetical protein
MITVATFKVKDRFTVEGVGTPIQVGLPTGSSAGVVAPVVSTGAPGATINAVPMGAHGGTGTPSASVSSSGGSDWSVSNLPQTYTSTAQLTTDAAWSGATIVDIQTGGSDFYTNLANTVAAAGGRCVVRLVGGTVYHLTSFRLIGGSGDQTYSFGFWFPNLRGFISNSTSQAIIQMDANSMSAAQLSALQAMTPSSGSSPNQMGLCRIDGSAASPVLLAGIKFRSADQQNLTSQAAGATPAMVVPQPAPHQGVVIYYNATSYISYCAFIGAGRASTSSPPFEQGNITTAQGIHHIHNCEFDGRRDAAIDAAQPTRCGPIMGNNETEHHLVDVWLHDSNVSRYAVNDQNSATSGTYEATRVKSERISNNHNIDPALNSGVSLGGYTNASNFGWESCNGTINVTDTIISVDDPNLDGQFPAHLQLTSVGSRNPQGGRLHVRGGTFHHTAFSQLEGYLTFRIAMTTFWWTDGIATTLDVRQSNNTPMTGWQFTGTWPPTAGQIATAGISPTTHYIYKGV